MKFPSLGTVLSYATTLASGIAFIADKAKVLPFPLPPWAQAAIGVASLAAAAWLHAAPSWRDPDALEATPGVEDNTGAALGKASGEAALRAANQAFKKL